MMPKVTDKCNLSSVEMDILLKYDIPLTVYLMKYGGEVFVYQYDSGYTGLDSYIAKIKDNVIYTYHWNGYCPKLRYPPLLSNFKRIENIQPESSEQYPS